MKKYVSWRRVSTQRQGMSGLGLEAQSNIISHFTQDGELICDYSETFTGKDLRGCAELQKAIAHAKRENAILVIAKTDRFRSLKEALEILDTMGDGNIMFCDLPNSDRFTLTLMFAISEREALITSIRTKQALQAKKDRGFKLGRPENLDNKSREKGSLANAMKAAEDLNNKRAASLSIELRNQGLTLQNIADKLNESGFSTANGFSWQPTSVMRNIKRFKINSINI